MTFLLKNLVLLHVALVMAGVAWIHGGTRVEHLAWLPWLTLLTLELVLLFPPARRGETLGAARRRIWHGLVRDPLLYVGLALTLFLLLQWTNGGRGLAYDVTLGAPTPRPPPFPRLPFCVDRSEACQLLYWFPPACGLVLAVRHAVTRRGRRLLLHLLVWNGALLALFGMVQNLSGTHALYWMTPLPGHFFASFGYPNHAGAYFALMGGVGLALFCQAVTDADHEGARSGWLLLPAIMLCTMGVWWSHSRAAILLFMGLLLAVLVYMLAYLWRRLGWGGRIHVAAFGLIALTAGWIVYYVICPANPVRQKMAAIDFSSAGAAAGSLTVRWIQVPVAAAMWHDHPWFGVGGWGYRDFVTRYVHKADWPRYIWDGAANVHNDAAQFLAEHGVCGLGLMLALAVLAFLPALRAMWGSRHHALIELNEDRLWIFRVPPAMLIALAALGCTVLHSLVDLPFRCPAVLCAWAVVIACLPASVPSRLKPT